MNNEPRTSGIVPQPKFLFWFAVVVLPFSALGMLYAEAQLVAVVLIAGLLVVATIDATLAFGRLNAVEIELPVLLRLSLGRPAVVNVTLRHPSGTPLALRIGLGLPGSLRPAHEELTVQLPSDTDTSSVPWPIEPVRRGRFKLTRVYLEGPSRLGLWGVRRSLPTACEVRVYPNLQRERKNLAALFLNRGALGVHARRQIGKGRDFEQLREYIAGDSFDEIHWKATAKRHHPVTKVFQIERTQEIYIVIDASRLSARRQGAGGLGTLREREISHGESRLETANRSRRRKEADGTAIHECPPPYVGGYGLAPEMESANDGADVLERFIASGLILAQAAEKQGDLFGLVTFTSQVGAFLRAKNGHAHYAACRDALYTLQAENVSPDFDEIVSFLRTRLRRRALLVFLTSLDDPVLAESFTRNMALLARQHLVLVNMIQSPGVAPLFNRDDDVADLDDLYRHLGGHLQWQRLQELRRTLQHRGVQFSLVNNERLATELVSQYLSVKQRQMI